MSNPTPSDIERARAVLRAAHNAHLQHVGALKSLTEFEIEAIAAALAAARQEERERCALVCERIAYDNPRAESASDSAYRCRDAIRALTPDGGNRE